MKVLIVTTGMLSRPRGLELVIVVKIIRQLWANVIGDMVCYSLYQILVFIIASTQASYNFRL
jgi:hypothetical protein